MMSEELGELARFHAVLIALSIVIILLGITGNITILYIYTFKIRLPVFGFFVRALATVDLVNTLYTIPSFVTFKTLPSVTDLQNGLCKFFGFTNHFSMLTTGIMYIAIAVQRFQKICRPHGTQMTASTARRVVALCMTLSLIVSAPIIFLVKLSPMTMDSMTVRMCSFKNETFSFHGQYNLPLYLSVWVFLEFLVITLALVVMYCRISKVLRGYTNLSITCGENLLKPTTAFSILTVVFFCTGIPVTVLCLYRSLTDENSDTEKWELHLTDLVVCLPFINCVVNPFVYSWSSGRFRAEVKATLCGPTTCPTE
ncbi:C3a anaphylatoxin chemotactic receptor-like [Haliotis rubra]|uniref:C3a anaphylatoxin chemotactic receptor-like n=1 Tax=Haliotis rubra TaxID=36100 RepID=UPI001EE56C33|nr:C3a anaphylatoxin chemotactic receptor-like [Haliotis rubra]